MYVDGNLSLNDFLVCPRKAITRVIDNKVEFV